MLQPSEVESYSQLKADVRSLYPHLLVRGTVLVQWKPEQVYCASKEVVTKRALEISDRTTKIHGEWFDKENIL
jgi:hypothetical protein